MMSKKMNAGDAAKLMLKLETLLSPAWSNITLLTAIHDHLSDRLSELYLIKQRKPEKAVQP